ncbi:MAG TPA: MATE family efflux transporter, partial [Bacillota bacterium]|nr:MATE family efflux transporter [Bacillota bacterium]
MKAYLKPKRYINMHLLKQIVLFALPIMAMNILQLLFNAADMIIVGRYSGSHALAAVGATGS